MKTLKEIKDDVAKRYGAGCWKNIKYDFLFQIAEKSIDYDGISDLAAELYALQEVKKHLEIAANEAQASADNDYGIINVNKKSITNIKIELT